jgi:hypothetical protein
LIAAISGVFTPTAFLAARKKSGCLVDSTPLTLSLIYSAATSADTLMSLSSESGLFTISKLSPVAFARF